MVFCFLVATARPLFGCLGALLDAVEIGQQQLGLDGLGIAHRVDCGLDMGDVAFLEAAQDVADRVDLADVGEELVAEPFALAGAADEAGDIDELQICRHDRR